MTSTINDKARMRMNNLSVIATRRESNLFSLDLESHSEQVRDSLNGSRVLVIGGAGSIGRAAISQIVPFQPAALHVVDINENGLAHLVRDLRSSKENIRLGDFRALPMDFGSPLMQRFLLAEKSYDHVLNFAAVKHVRSEKDIYSILHMLDTNVLKVSRLSQWLGARGNSKTLFAVSTDKAANPVNLMGASKRLMEHVLFAETVTSVRKTSARFANVAFSSGSLLQSWIRRMERHEPLPVPRETRRFFISLEESGSICVLAALCGADRRVFIPDLDPENELQELQAVAERFLRYCGYTPKYYEDEDAARLCAERDLEKETYPLLLTPLDTSGEKDYEEFVGAGETVSTTEMPHLLSIDYKPCDEDRLIGFLRRVQGWISSTESPVDKSLIVEAIHSVVPELKHAARDKCLDERM